MLPIPGINYVAVIVATIVAMIVGMIWYSKPLFGDIWMKEMGMDPKKPMKMSPVTMLGALFGSLLSALVLAVLMRALMAFTFVDGFLVALYVWAGFYVSVELVRLSFSKDKPIKLFLVNIAHYLIALAAMSAVVVIMGVPA